MPTADPPKIGQSRPSVHESNSGSPVYLHTLAGADRGADHHRKDIVKAWQFTDTHAPLTLVELPGPVPASGQVVVTVKQSAFVTRMLDCSRTKSGCNCCRFLSCPVTR